MKTMKRIATIMLAVCLLLPGGSLVVNAADGRVSFTDPKTKTGETVEVACALRAATGSLETFDVTLKYDPEFLAFENGEAGVTKESDGVLKFSGKGNGTGRIGFKMNFQALKVGTTKIEVTDSSGFLTSGEDVTCTNGNSTIKITQGTAPVTATSGNEAKVMVGDKEYSLMADFPKTSIPVGFTEGTITYDGGEQKIVQNETGTIKLGYLVDAEGKGNFFLYNAEDATFSPYTQVTVSPTTAITILKADKGMKVPSDYQEVKLTLNEHEFPAWQDKKHDGFYLVYAMNQNGEKSFYQYDTQEESYQRFIVDDAANSKENAKNAGKIEEIFNKNLSVIMLVTGLGLLLAIIVIIVLAIKLRHRNLELDDLYGDIDMEDEEDPLSVGADNMNKRNQFKKQPREAKGSKRKEEELEDDFEDFDDDFEDDFEEDDFKNKGYEEDDYEDDFDFENGFEVNFDDSDFADESDDYYEEEKPAKKARKVEKREDDFDYEDEYDDDDDFEVDFIDLD